MGRNSMFKPNGRMFSSEVATINAPVDPAVAKTASGVQTLWEYSENEAAKAAAKRHEEAAYLQSMQDAMADRSAWKPMEETANDTVYIKKLKAKINSIVE